MLQNLFVIEGRTINLQWPVWNEIKNWIEVWARLAHLDELLVYTTSLRQYLQILMPETRLSALLVFSFSTMVDRKERWCWIRKIYFWLSNANSAQTKNITFDEATSNLRQTIYEWYLSLCYFSNYPAWNRTLWLWKSSFCQFQDIGPRLLCMVPHKQTVKGTRCMGQWTWLSHSGDRHLHGAVG